MKATFRNCCWTSFKAELEYEEKDIKYMVYQLEECRETGRAHWQGYVEFKKVKTIRQAKEALGDIKAHLEPRRGTREEARDYCMKKDTRLRDPVEVGTFGKGQGERTDLKQVADEVKEGKKIREIAEAHPVEYIKFNRGIEKLKNVLSEKKFRKVKTYFLYGKAGCGKSSFAYQKYGIENVFPISFDKGSLWFDGYDGEKVLLIDDFYGEIPYGELMKICDIYPYMARVKGGFVAAKWKRVFITSELYYTNWYPQQRHIGGLARRLTVNPKNFAHYVMLQHGGQVGFGMIYNLQSGVGNTMPPLDEIEDSKDDEKKEAINMD